jgi:DNA-binding NtrC family response regulator
MNTALNAQVLVVDDEPAVSSALRRLLKRHGFLVEVADSGTQALQKLTAFVPDIVLSDFRMPGMSGPQLLAEVKRRIPDALRFIVSGYADVSSMAPFATNEDLCHFISKPWDDEELPRLLLQELGDRQLTAHPAEGKG